MDIKLYLNSCTCGHSQAFHILDNKKCFLGSCQCESYTSRKCTTCGQEELLHRLLKWRAGNGQCKKFTFDNSRARSMPQPSGPTDAEKAAAQQQREAQMRNGQVSMPPGWHPPTNRDTGLPIGEIMMHGGQHLRPGHTPTLGDRGRPIKPPLLP